MADLARPAVYTDILSEHLEELDFLWEQRERYLFAADWTLADLAALEERAEAHRDGLRIGAGHSIELALAALESGEPGAATAAVFVLMDTRESDLESKVVEALAGPAGAVRDGVRVALRQCDVSRIRESLTRVATTADSPARVAAADIMAFHRMPTPPRFADLLTLKEPLLMALVLGAVGRFGGPWSVDLLQSGLDSDAPLLRWAALECSARIGAPQLADHCRRAAQRRTGPSPEALAFLGVLGARSDFPIIEASLANSLLAESAVRGLGALGDTRAVPVLLHAAEDPALAIPAGEAFVRITGARGIEAEAALPPPPGLSQEELDFRDEAKPPAPTKMKTWWQKEAARFGPAGRWQSGRDVAGGPAAPCFNALPLPIRRDLFLGARAADPQGTGDLELESRVELQLRRRVTSA